MNGVESISRKSQYFNVPDLIELHRDCKNWLSEIAFWKDEIVFLKSVPQRYLEKISDENQITNLRFLISQINGDLADELCLLEDKTISFETMLAGLIQNSFIFDEQTCRDFHKDLRVRIEDFRNFFEYTREEIKNVVRNAFRKPLKEKS